jgi:drug/metabolite transporter (DMT)-like permease
LVGFLGVIFIFWDGFHDLLNPGYRLGILTLIIAVMSWGLGTIYIKKLQIENRNLFLNLFYQFAFAGIIQLAFAFSSAKTIDVSTWSLESIAAILYLAIFGSVVAFFSYHYLLKTLLPTQVSMLSYVNTVISIVLSWLILNETISAKFIIATVFIISGVFIINYKPGILKKRLRKREI